VTGAEDLWTPDCVLEGGNIRIVVSSCVLCGVCCVEHYATSLEFCSYYHDCITLKYDTIHCREKSVNSVFCDIYMDYILSYTVWRMADVLTLTL